MDQDEEFRAPGLPASFAAHMAQHHARRTHLRETTGIDVPPPGDMKAGAGLSAYMQASDLLLSGNFSGAQEALRQAVADASASGNAGAAGRLQALHDQVSRAEYRPALPPLAHTGRVSRSTITAVDHHGTEHVVRLRDGQVTVCKGDGALSAPAGDHPTATARALAGQLAELEGLAAAAVPDLEAEA